MPSGSIPALPGQHFNLGNVVARLGNYEAARAHYADTIRLDPNFVDAYDAIAMLMTTCPETKFRDREGAVAFATRACELTNWRDPRFLRTLAAAHAEAGDFDAAVIWQERAIDLLTDERQRADYRSRLELYKAKKKLTVRHPHGTPRLE